VPEALDESARAGQYRIGPWYWELERFPPQWMHAFHAVDELWVASPFIRDCLARVSPRPVLLISPPVEVSLRRAYARADFGLPADKFLFLFSYDFDSYVQRKNPRACIAAFLEAFAPGNDRVMLAIKTLHGDRYPEQLAELRAIARADPRVRLLELSLSRDESFGLISVCDSYLSLHRSEGFGLGMAEAMALGKPVVATGYSGNLAFMRPDNSCLVGYRLVPVGADKYLQGEGQVWAEPDIADAARQMRRLVQDAAFRVELGARAARHMAEHFSARAVGLRVRERLEAIAAWRARGP
jgi:glycosyltransferase involved in cell wall biosynthesis